MLVCYDRRWPKAYREMGLMEGEELIMLGYNTPTTNGQGGDEDLEKRIFHSTLCMQAGAYQNSCWVVGVAKAGVEDGHGLFGGSVIVDPDGTVVVQTETDEDELITARSNRADACIGRDVVNKAVDARKIGGRLVAERARWADGHIAVGRARHQCEG